ncbi:hypothetical protein CHS0354_027413 [Potamilus streckersoni]|uniref:EamA domain-containing protein n=1 Tax=Potamilus streckersoni TaxID=2493646 RepID=A0AAE0VZ79_9BIVA|nr:hypothetical protein CHS0354_027413 [Potamilus streckersoni]
MLIGLIGVIIFGLTLPFTRSVVAYMNPLSIAFCRAAVAGITAFLILQVTRSPWPNRRQALQLFIVGCGVIIGFPVLSAMALQTVPSSHGGVILGTLPLCTSVLGTIVNKERPSVGYWITAVIGALLVMVYSFREGVGQFGWGDVLLVGSAISASLGYVVGVSLSKDFKGWQVICWALVLMFPVIIIPAWIYWPADFFSFPAVIRAEFLYLALMSQLGGFFFWYKGLAVGGVARVSQVQLLQTAVTLIASVFILGEVLTPDTLLFAALVILVITVNPMQQKKKDFISFFNESQTIPENKSGAKLTETFNYWIFRYEDIVYKVLKKEIKPVSAAIEAHYMEKLQKNAHTLSPNLGFEVWSLELNNGKYELLPLEESEGNTVHFVFKMVYLAPAKMLSTLIEKNKLEFKHLKIVCESLHDFHKRADVMSDRYTGTHDHMQKIFDDLVFQSKKHLHKTFSEAVINMTTAPAQRFLAEHKRLLFSRMKNGRIREIHRCFIPSKICIGKDEALFIPMHFDSISQNYNDVASDVADLVFSLLQSDYKDLSQKFLDHYYRISKDEEMRDLMLFYLVLKGYQRGLYESLKLSMVQDPEEQELILSRAVASYDKAATLATELSSSVTQKIRSRAESAPVISNSNDIDYSDDADDSDAEAEENDEE